MAFEIRFDDDDAEHSNFHERSAVCHNISRTNLLTIISAHLNCQFVLWP